MSLALSILEEKGNVLLGVVPTDNLLEILEEVNAFARIENWEGGFIIIDKEQLNDARDYLEQMQNVYSIQGYQELQDNLDAIEDDIKESATGIVYYHVR